LSAISVRLYAFDARDTYASRKAIINEINYNKYEINHVDNNNNFINI